MKKYLGVKIVEAEPCFGRNNKCVPENSEFDGTEVEGYKLVYEDGYVSWSPKEVFEKAYKELQEQDLGLSIVFLNTVSGNWRYSFEGEDTGVNPMKLTFGQAIEALKQGKKVARTGWNGKGMWLKLVNMQQMAASPDYPEVAWTDELINLPTIAMKTADDKLLFGWLASQTDMLAEDWQIVE